MNFFNEPPRLMVIKYGVDFFEQSITKKCLAVLPHIHSAIEMLYFTNGNYSVNINGVYTPVSRGDIVLFRPNTIHSIWHTDNSFGCYYVLQISSDLLLNFFKSDEGVKYILPFLSTEEGDKSIFTKDELSDKITGIWQSMIDEYKGNKLWLWPYEKAYSCALIVELFKQFFLQTAKEKKDVPSINVDMLALIHESLTYINENYAEDLTAAECAKQINLSYSYYAKLFHAVVGKSFKEYHREVKLSQAYNYLVTTTKSITDIAFACGYKSSAYFSKEYKEVYGVTPKETRKLKQ